MILPFMTHWGKDMPLRMEGKPTYFVEKIWEGIVEMDEYKQFPCIPLNDFSDRHLDKFGENWDNHYDVPFLKIPPKLHTIRHDPNDRWKEGRDIHFYINNRTKKAFQFAPVIKCKCVQTINIVYDRIEVLNYYFYSGIMVNGQSVTVFIDDKIIPKARVVQLAINDGFDSVDDFFAYFNKDFSGKIIHWTDLKY